MHVLARGTGDPEGAAVGHATSAGGISRARVRANTVDAQLRRRLDGVSRASRGRSAERGFAMAMDDLYAEPRPPFRDRRAHGRARRRFPAPRAHPADRRLLAEHDAAPARLAQRAHGVPRRGDRRLGRADRQSRALVELLVFADVLRAERGPPLLRATRTALLALDRLFQLQRLITFNRKFFPEWRPRYVCVEHLSDLPLVGMAYLHVESLLIPPGPWTRRSTAAPHSARRCGARLEGTVASSSGPPPHGQSSGIGRWVVALGLDGCPGRRMRWWASRTGMSKDATGFSALSGHQPPRS